MTSQVVHFTDLPPAQRHAYLQHLRGIGRGRRVYMVDAWRAGNVAVAEGKLAVSQGRIRAVLANRFRSVFGHAPTFTWHADGRMGEAWDNRGNRVSVCQLNEQPGWRGDGQAG